MWRLQFVVKVESIGTALAYPYEWKGQAPRLTHSAFETMLYGCEETAVDDCSRWFNLFPQIQTAEAVRIVEA